MHNGRSIVHVLARSEFEGLLASIMAINAMLLPAAEFSIFCGGFNNSGGPTEVCRRCESDGRGKSDLPE